MENIKDSYKIKGMSMLELPLSIEIAEIRKKLDSAQRFHDEIYRMNEKE